MWKKLRIPRLLVLTVAALLGCQDQQITAPEGTAFARVLQNGEFEEPCGSPLTVALRDATGTQVGQATVWNGETTAYVRLTAPEGWEFTEVRVDGALQPHQFPRTAGVVDPSRFQFGGAVSPVQSEVVIETMWLGNPHGVEPEDEVLLSAFARVRPEGNGSEISAWAEGIPFQQGQHPMYFRYTVQECEDEPPPDNEPPVAEILSPEDGAEFTEGEEITFSGSATDPEDGDLSGNALVWTSSLDGVIGTGPSFTRSDLSVGTHTITLTATDSEGATGSASVEIEVVQPPTIGSIILPDITIGGWLEAAIFLQLSVQPTSNVTVRVTSSDPTKVLLALGPGQPGSGSIDVVFLAGVTPLRPIWVQGIEATTGPVTLTATAEGWDTGTSTATVVQAALTLRRANFINLPSSISADADNLPFIVIVSIPGVPRQDRVRVGSGGLLVTLTSSNPGVAQLVTSTAVGGEVTVQIAEGQRNSPTSVAAGGVELDPLSPGTTTIRATAPNATPAVHNLTVVAGGS